MTAEDIMAMKAMSEGTDMSSYEHFMIADKSGKRASGTSIAAITVAGVGVAAAIGAWIYAGTSASSVRRSSEREIDKLTAFSIADRNERVNFQGATNKTIVDIVSGAQAGANSNSVSSAYAQAEAQILANALTGKSQLCPQPVALYSAPQPCGCPTSCCG